MSNISLNDVIYVLEKWSNNEISRRDVEQELNNSNLEDENIDNVFKVHELFRMFFSNPKELRENDYFNNLDNYTLLNEDFEGSNDEHKSKILESLIELVIESSQWKYTVDQLLDISYKIEFIIYE